jgi:asparagine synthase (glutamine-hydrolysing)
MLAAFERWGVNRAIERCAGMFAFGLWDRKERRLFLGRDRIGEKPLYYGWIGRTLVFASEVKALKAHPAWRGEVNRDALALFLRHNYIPAPHSIYKGILKIRPGTIAAVDASRQVTEHTFWSMAEAAERGAANPIRTDDEDASRQLEHLLRRTVRQQMVSDVPLGAFLSGGVDSSLIVGLMQAESARPVKTFTIKFDEPAYDESRHARAVADHLKTDHTELTVTAEDARNVIPSLPDVYDEPFSDSSQIPTYLVSRLARQHVTVALSGDGGDEFFAGYPRYAATLQLWKGLSRSPQLIRTFAGYTLRSVSVRRWNRLAAIAPAAVGRHSFALGDRAHKLARLLSHASLEETYRQFVTHWPNPAETALHASEPATALTDRDRWPTMPTALQRLMYLDAVSYLPDDIFVKVDRAAMAVSLETRAPFVDHRVAEFAWRMPADLNFRGNRGKLTFRRILDRYVPRQIIERPKMGFGVPIDEWLRGPLRDWAEALLSEDRLRREGFFDPAGVRQKWNEHQQGHRRWHYHLWDVLMFQAWLERQ